MRSAKRVAELLKLGGSWFEAAKRIDREARRSIRGRRMLKRSASCAREAQNEKKVFANRPTRSDEQKLVCFNDAPVNTRADDRFCFALLPRQRPKHAVFTIDFECNEGKFDRRATRDFSA